MVIIMDNLNDLVNSLSDSKIIELVASLGCDEYKDTSDAIIFRTICHNCDANDASMKLYYYKKSKLFHCYTECSCSFNIIELFKKRYELLDIDYNFYRDIILKIGGERGRNSLNQNFFIPYESLYDNKKNSITVNIPSINKGLLNVYEFYPTEEWRRDGISDEVMRHYNILYSPNENKIIIPHYDINNNLIGIRSRSLNEEDLLIGKYMPVKIEGKIYSHPLAFNLYGLNFVKENIKKYKMAIIAESEKASLQYETMFGQENNICVACCGSNISRYQIELLLNSGAERIIIAFDKEGVTWKEKEKYYNKLYNICKKYRSICLMGFVYDNKNLLELKDSPFDKGREITQELLKRTIWT